MKVASIQYSFDLLVDFEGYQAKITALLQTCKKKGAEIVLLPEYGSYELAALFPGARNDMEKEMQEMQSLLERYISLFQNIAKSLGLYICAGSFPVKEASSYRNRAFFFAPSGHFDTQDKIQMTRFEKESQLLYGGKEIKVFDTALGKIGIAICYDSEFPSIVRKQVESGAKLILVPSCTDTIAGFYRVNVSCRARAMENQCYTVQSPLVGKVPWSVMADINYGLSGIYTPIDNGFPSDGILIEGKWNQPDIVIADIDLSLIDNVRIHGQVCNHQDWLALGPIQVLERPLS